MPNRNAPDNLEKVLDRAAAAGDGSKDVSVAQIMSSVGRRSFGPILFIIALIALTPLGGFPGIPTLLAVTVILIAGQLVIGMEHFWLPKFVLNRSMEKERFGKMIGYAKPVARAIDRVLRERLVWIFRPTFVRLAAIICILVMLTVPPMEVVPFAGTVQWAAVAIFALALVTRDGLLALIAFAFALAAGYMVFAFLV